MDTVGSFGASPDTLRKADKFVGTRSFIDRFVIIRMNDLEIFQG